MLILKFLQIFKNISEKASTKHLGFYRGRLFSI